MGIATQMRGHENSRNIFVDVDILPAHINDQNVEIQQEDPSENYAPTLGWSLKLFLGQCLFIDA